MNRVYIVSLVLLTYGCAGKQISPERKQELGAIQFRHSVTIAGKAMDIQPPPHIVLTDDILHDDETIPMSIYQIPVVRMPYYTTPQFVIRVRKVYLRDYPFGGLEHGATHEICHAKLGHLDRVDDDDTEEHEAERCTYYFLGEEKYVAFFQHHAKWSAARYGKYEELAKWSEDKFRYYIRLSFGLEDPPSQ